MGEIFPREDNNEIRAGGLVFGLILSNYPIRKI